MSNTIIFCACCPNYNNNILPIKRGAKVEYTKTPIGNGKFRVHCEIIENGRKMFDCINAGDFVGARKYLDNILLLRDTMLANSLMPSFTYCMNLLGCEGNFHQDYCLPITDEAKRIMEETMKQIGEI